MKDINILKAACDAIVADPTLMPKKDSNGNIVETHCNFGAIRVANAMGCHDLDGIMADQQYEIMEKNISGMWEKVIGKLATEHALAGGLAFAAMTSTELGEAHGHIAAVYPVPMQFSGSLGKNVPMVANVGKTDAEEKESAAFPISKGEADYFVWNG